ncbi:histidinol-phosphatase [Sporosarcina sp. P12(2017)]|uniref:histidinol-phosphatase HisJ family protein n=1 Tax=unclassified Sporosarcina TaxID=2647733 RepID=UPI000C168BAA|nr:MULTISPECIES: histidinol-phosphatase HisJ family protein [unclassified Sporosarcina]PIC56054.1 histidinol-phosphatase [Sporosarcina sp. P10]PIC59381.1 histidinol-phosphatase [Sporosarcina sp. P12(2017)]
MFDYHMHSAFSADCEIPMEEMAKASIAKGLTEICFTDHIDYEYPDETIHFDFDKIEYAQKILQLNEQFDGQLTIKKGVEIGLQPDLLHLYEELMDEHEFDFVICSLHTVENKSLHYRELFEDRSTEAAFETYYKELLYCVQNYKRYSVLGHADLIKRYTDQPPANLFHDYLEKIFNTIIPDGKGIELNTSGTRYGLPHNMPSEDILRLYKQCGGEIITLGSDAHRTTEIAHEFKESLELYQSIGFNYLATFTEGQPEFHKISSL